MSWRPASRALAGERIPYIRTGGGPATSSHDISHIIMSIGASNARAGAVDLRYAGLLSRQRECSDYFERGDAIIARQLRHYATAPRPCSLHAQHERALFDEMPRLLMIAANGRAFYFAAVNVAGARRSDCTTIRCRRRRHSALIARREQCQRERCN